MKRLKRYGFVVGVLLSVSGSAHAGETAATQRQAIEALMAEEPAAGVLMRGDRVSRLYGRLFEGGASPQDSASRFLAARAAVLGVEQHHLKPGNRVGLDTQPIMLDRETGQFRFTAVYKRHEVDGAAVHDSFATLLMRNEPGHPVVLVVNSLKPVGAFRPDPTLRIDAQRGRNLARAIVPAMERFTAMQRIIWVGDDGPRDAYRFEGDGVDPLTNMPRHELFVIDARTHLLLHRKSLIHHEFTSAQGGAEVHGEVTGFATPGLFPDGPGNPPQLMPLADATVHGSEGQTAVTDDDGHFMLPGFAFTPGTITSALVGPWANVVSMTSPNLILDSKAEPSSFLSFVHNESFSELSTAQVNAMLHTNLVRNFVTSANPEYPGMQDQLLVRVNLNQNCNAFFTSNPLSINFFTSAGADSCPNTAYSSVVYHEYGHYIINRAGTSQGAYGEGMSDSLSILVTDDPSLGQDFQGSGAGPLRSGINNVSYPCVGGVHTCGQVLSGAIWHMRELLAKSRPDDYREILADLVINSILLNPPGIGPGLVYDLLTLDGGGSYLDGTPHYEEIVTAFTMKGIAVTNLFNNSCQTTFLITAGEYTVSTEHATTNGLEEPLCAGTGSEQIYNDRWYGHLAQCEGTLTISLCGSDYPAKLGVYDFPCPSQPGDLLACTIATCDEQQTLVMNVTQGQPVRIRLGGQFPDVVGTALLTLTCTPAPQCSGDLNGDGVVDVSDLLSMLEAWGDCPANCPADLTGTGTVDVSDLLTLLGAWGACDG